MQVQPQHSAWIRHFLRPNYWGKDAPRDTESSRSSLWSWLNFIMNPGTVKVEMCVALPEARCFPRFRLGTD